MILFVQWLVSAVHSSAAENWAEHKLVVRLLENYNPQVSPFDTAQIFRNVLAELRFFSSKNLGRITGFSSRRSTIKLYA